MIVGRDGEVGWGPDAGIVHQDVDRPSFVLDLIDEGGNQCRVREIGGVGGTPKLGRERLKGILGPGDERDGGPCPGEGMGERLADAS